ncbi:MAG TPA: hypothetical protein VK477_13075 [Acidobacteriota bacterium]|nr:hypothetical protein [Acidobacteriota bacterium]
MLPQQPEPPPPSPGPTFDPAVVDYLNAPRRAGEPEDRSLFRIGLGGLVALTIYYAYSAVVEDPLHLYFGLMILALGCLPALLWARGDSKPFPIFETFMLTSVNAYAIPLLSGHQQLGSYPSEVITTAALGVLLFQITSIGCYFFVRAHPRRTPFWSEPIVTDKLSRYLSYGMVLTTIYTLFSSFYRELLFKFLPNEAEGVLRATFFGIGIVATFLAARRWGAGTLPRSDKTFFTVNFIIQVILQCASLFLVGGISMIVLALLGYVSAARRLPLGILLVVIPFLGILHNGKSELRAKYWTDGAKPVGLTDLPSFYLEWIQQGVTFRSESEKQKNSTAKLLERTSLFHIMCLVVASCPDRQPFLYGETYKHIPGQFVPRFFWPNKPVGHISTNTLSRYFGLQTEEDTQKTTIGFGMVAEAYANFGFYGIAVIACLIGTVFKKLTRWGAESPLVSYGGLLLVVLIAWSFQIELTLSIWLNSLFQACVAVLGVPMFIRSFGS